MQKHKSGKITLKVLFALLITIIVSMTVFGLYIYIQSWQNGIQELRNQADQISKRLETGLVGPLWNFDEEQMKVLSLLELNNRNVQAIIIKDEKGQPYLGFAKLDFKHVESLDANAVEQLHLKGTFLIKKSKILHEKSPIGFVEIYLTDHFIKKSLFNMLIKIIAQMILITVFISFVVFISLKKIVLDKLLALDQAIIRFSERDWSARADESSNDELGHLGKNLNTMADTIREYSEHLEDLVDVRTKEVKALLEQQHGDYYLTSLLVTPLIQNEVKHSLVNVEFYLEQKKKFKFRHWEAQIGGDLCVSKIISLNGREFTLFANADAMGKSLQGAGGAIIYGVVLNNFISDTLENPAYQRGYSPEKWLQTIFESLQKIFLVFKGRMLISTIIGLLDNRSGELYYFNCEHPWLVRYQKGKAEFLDSEKNIIHKIGVENDENKKIAIRKLILKAGDVLFLGSDGKDDLNLASKEEERDINSDERLFLKFIEQNQGDLNEIVRTIKSYGEVTDDLSVMRVAFIENFERDQEKLEKIGLRLKEDGSIEDLNSSPLAIAQDDFETLEKEKKKAVGLFNKKNFDEAFEVLKPLHHVFRRKKDRFDVAFMLGQCYVHKKNYPEALATLKEALEIQPEHEQIKILIEKIKHLTKD